MSYTEVSGFRFFIIFFALLIVGDIIISQLLPSTQAGLFIWTSIMSYLVTSFVKKEFILFLPKVPGFRYGGKQSRWHTFIFILAILILGLIYDPNLENLKTPYTVIVLLVGISLGYLMHRLISKYVVIKRSI